MSDASLTLGFLGPCGNHDALPEALIVEFLHDHVCWRRNVRPQDPPTPRGAAANAAVTEPTGAAARPRPVIIKLKEPVGLPRSCRARIVHAE